MTPEHSRQLMALFLHAAPEAVDAALAMHAAIRSDELPLDVGERRDIALQVEAGGGRVSAVASAWWERLQATSRAPLVAMRGQVDADRDPQVRFGEVYALAHAPSAETLPAGYRWAAGGEPHHPDLASWLQEEPTIAIVQGEVAIAGIFPRPYPDTPFVGSPVCVVPDHRGRGLAKCLIAAQAARTQADGGVPIALISDGNTASRRAFRAVGYNRALVVGALSVAVGVPRRRAT